MSKIRVAVLRGGPSDEYSVSLKTGAAVLAELDKNLFEPLDVVITRSGEWLLGGIERYPEFLLPVVDVVFLALHGSYGEDGTVQRLLERFSIPYTGSNSYASRIAMHKGYTKEHLREAAEVTLFKLAPHLVVTRNSESNLHRISTQISNVFGPEYVLKPVASGSSVGVAMVSSPAELQAALENALHNYGDTIVEQRIHGREATCGVVERYRGEALYALPPIEIVPPKKADFFDNTCKYNGTTSEICPARFDHDTKRSLEIAAKVVHDTLGLSQYSRSDFIVAEDGVYFLEVNTLPGLTTESLLPKAIDTVGGKYSDFITHLLLDALQVKHARKSVLSPYV